LGNCKDRTGKHSIAEENPSIKVNNNVINSPKLVANSFNTYFLITVEKTKVQNAQQRKRQYSI
jgi:hypothetical protein